jgi:phosphoglycerate dehydrogenase-like enzyme
VARGNSELRSRVVVIELGTFGQHVARTLFGLGYELTAIDPVTPIRIG